MVSPEIFREKELSGIVKSFLVLHDKCHNGFEERNAVKNAWDGVVTRLEFIPTSN